MTNQARPIVDELTRVAERLFGILPELLAAIVILLVGWLIARLLRALTVRFAGVANRTIARLGVRMHTPVGSMRQSSTRVVGEIVFWIVILIFLTAATSVLGLQVFTGWLDRLVGYLPQDPVRHPDHLCRCRAGQHRTRQRPRRVSRLDRQSTDVPGARGADRDA